MIASLERNFSIKQIESGPPKIWKRDPQIKELTAKLARGLLGVQNYINIQNQTNIENK